jgi:hypothetical protein
MDQIKINLGQALSAKQIAEYTGLDVKTVRKYYRTLGGIRVGARILFFEKEFIDAIQTQSQVVCTGPERGPETGKGISHEEGSGGLGSHDEAKSSRRLEHEDRHGLFS